MKAAKDNQTTQTTIQNVNIKIDPVVKESAESVLANMGLNMSAYIGMCLRQLAQDREIPFTQKADPEFWATEYRAYKTKRIVDSGILMPVSKLYSGFPDFFSKVNGELIAKLLAAKITGASPRAIEFANKAFAALAVPFDESLCKTHIAISMLQNSISNIEKVFFVNTPKNEQDAKLFTAYKEALESIDNKILDGCFEIVENADTDIIELFATVFDVDATEDADFAITRENSVVLVDELFRYAIDAYNENQDSIILRYTGQVGGSALATILSTASMSPNLLSSCHIDNELIEKLTTSTVDKAEGGEQND